MTRTKLGLLGLCAVVVGMMTMSAGAAQGSTFSWLILNAKGEAVFLLATLAGEKDSEHLVLEGKVAGFPVAIMCNNFTLNGVMLETGGKLTSGGKVVFTGCGVYHSASLSDPWTGCSVKTGSNPVGTIESGEGKGELVLIGTKLLTKIEPLAGPTGNFASLKMEGSECTLPALNQVHGTLYIEDCKNEATTHLEKHLIQPDQTDTAMYIGGHSAEQLSITKVLGSAFILLTGEHKGLLWGAMDV